VTGVQGRKFTDNVKYLGLPMIDYEQALASASMLAMPREIEIINGCSLADVCSRSFYRRSFDAFRNFSIFHQIMSLDDFRMSSRDDLMEMYEAMLLECRNSSEPSDGKVGYPDPDAGVESVRVVTYGQLSRQAYLLIRRWYMIGQMKSVISYVHNDANESSPQLTVYPSVKIVGDNASLRDTSERLRLVIAAGQPNVIAEPSAYGDVGCKPITSYLLEATLIAHRLPVDLFYDFELRKPVLRIHRGIGYHDVRYDYMIGADREEANCDLFISGTYRDLLFIVNGMSGISSAILFDYTTRALDVNVQGYPTDEFTSFPGDYKLHHLTADNQVVKDRIMYYSLANAFWLSHFCDFGTASEESTARLFEVMAFMASAPFPTPCKERNYKWSRDTVLNADTLDRQFFNAYLPSVAGSHLSFALPASNVEGCNVAHNVKYSARPRFASHCKHLPKIGGHCQVCISSYAVSSRTPRHMLMLDAEHVFIPIMGERETAYYLGDDCVETYAEEGFHVLFRGQCDSEDPNAFPSIFRSESDSDSEHSDRSANQAAIYHIFDSRDPEFYDSDDLDEASTLVDSNVIREQYPAYSQSGQFLLTDDEDDDELEKHDDEKDTSRREGAGDSVFDGECCDENGSITGEYADYLARHWCADWHHFGDHLNAQRE